MASRSGPRQRVWLLLYILSTEDNCYAYGVVTPAVKCSFVRIGVRCSFSSDSLILVGFLVGSSSVVLLDLFIPIFLFYIGSEMNLFYMELVPLSIRCLIDLVKTLYSFYARHSL